MGIASRNIRRCKWFCGAFPVSAWFLLLSWLIGGDWDTRAIALWRGLRSHFGIGGLVVFTALAEGTMSVVSPITSVLAALIPVLFGLMTGEQLSVGVLAGIAFAVVAIVLISQEGKHSAPHLLASEQPKRLNRRVLLFTVGTGVAFALSFILIHQIGENRAGLWPMFAGKTTASVVTLLIALRFGHVRIA